jgi:hypothetical protein
MITLPEPPEKGEPHLVADWVELACASDEDGTFSGSRLVEARQDADQRESAAGGSGQPPTSGDDDAHSREADDVWLLLRSRADAFGGSYPFAVDPDETAIATRARNRQRNAYAFLLCAASLNAVRDTERGALAAAFERTSFHVVASLLPGRSRVAVFGSAAPEGTRYWSGNLKTRLRRLADDIGSALTESAEDISDYNSGDGGLDVVGWSRLGSPNTRVAVIFAQCACGRDWLVKQGEVDPNLWSTRMTVTALIVPVTVIPYAFRNEDGSWYREFQIKNGVLIDRVRYLALLRKRGAPAYADVPSGWIRSALPGLRPAA